LGRELTRRAWWAALLGLVSERMGVDMGFIGMAEELIKREEGFSAKPYADSRDTVAIGWGRNLTLRGISEDEAELMLRNDLEAARRTVVTMFGSVALSRMGEARVAVLMSMAHQLGAAGLAGFRKMREALRVGDWSGAAAEALDSRWALQTPERARRVAAVLERGVLEALGTGDQV
jgi:lysozyme